MVETEPIDNYNLTLEAATDGPGVQSFRAIATKTRNGRIVETMLEFESVRSLLMHTYGGEISIVDVFLDRLVGQQVVELDATAKDLVILTAGELIRFGFSPDHTRDHKERSGPSHPCGRLWARGFDVPRSAVS